MSNWENNTIQFPRLLAEIMATQDALNIPALAESMDLTVDEVGELFDRADAIWQRIKAGCRETIDLPMNGFDEGGNVVRTSVATLSIEQIADIVDHARQLIIVRQSARRSSGDTEGPLAELEEALGATDLLDTLE